MSEVGRAMYRVAHGISQPLRYERWFPVSYFTKAGFRTKPQRTGAESWWYELKKTMPPWEEVLTQALAAPVELFTIPAGYSIRIGSVGPIDIRGRIRIV